MNIILKSLAAPVAALALMVSGANAQSSDSQTDYSQSRYSQATGRGQNYPEHRMPEHIYPVIPDEFSDTQRAEIKQDVRRARVEGELAIKPDSALPRPEEPAAGSGLSREEVRSDARTTRIDPRFNQIYYLN